MRWLICVFLMGCSASSKFWDGACYSGGTIFWKGKVTKLYLYKDGNCIYFSDLNGVETKVCNADCYFSEAGNGETKKE